MPFIASSITLVCILYLKVCHFYQNRSIKQKLPFITTKKPASVQILHANIGITNSLIKEICQRNCRRAYDPAAIGKILSAWRAIDTDRGGRAHAL